MDFKVLFPIAGRRRAGRHSAAGGLQPLSASERAEGRTGNDRGPVEASQRPTLPVHLLEPSTGGNKENARSVEHSEKQRGKRNRHKYHVERKEVVKKNTSRKQSWKFTLKAIQIVLCEVTSTSWWYGVSQERLAHKSYVLEKAAQTYCSGMWRRRKYASLIPWHVAPCRISVFSDPMSFLLAAALKVVNDSGIGGHS